MKRTIIQGPSSPTCASVTDDGELSVSAIIRDIDGGHVRTDGGRLRTTGGWSGWIFALLLMDHAFFALVVLLALGK